MKRILLFFATMLVLFFCNSSIVDASDYYLGVYPNGETAYLDTDSVRANDVYHNGYFEGRTYSCNVKSVDYNSDTFTYIQYEIWYGQTATIRKNGNQVFSTMRGPYDYLEKNPVEQNLMNYINTIDRNQF